jgi:hypothetical protein
MDEKIKKLWIYKENFITIQTFMYIKEIFQEFFRSKNRTSANFLGEVFFRTETELKIRNEIERKMQDNQPNVEKEKWLSV